MKYISLKQPGGSENLMIAEGPKPAPGPGEVLIEVHAAGVNRPDILQRKGAYPPPPGASPILGLEVAGIVAEAGEGVDTFRVGGPVCALVAGGGYAEYCVAPAPQCLPVPRGLEMTAAAGIPETFFTVWANVVMRGRLASGETILIHGGTSGIGTAAVQVARELGAKVFVTVGSEAKAQAARGLGAVGAILYKSEDFVTQLKRLNGGRGANLILDMVAGDYFARNLEALEPEGRLVQIAVQKGDQVQLSLRSIMSKGLTITGSTLRPRSVAQKGEIARQLHEQVWPWFEQKRVRAVIDHVFPLADAAEAHRRMEAGDHIGKIILAVSSSL